MGSPLSNGVGACLLVMADREWKAAAATYGQRKVWRGRVSLLAFVLNSRARHYAARRSSATRRHQSDEGDELRTAGFPDNSAWDSDISPTNQAKYFLKDKE